MRHTLTLIVGMVLGRVLTRAITSSDTELIILTSIISICVGIFVYLLAKNNIK